MVRFQYSFGMLSLFRFPYPPETFCVSVIIDGYWTVPGWWASLPADQAMYLLLSDGISCCSWNNERHVLVTKPLFFGRNLQTIIVKINHGDLFLFVHPDYIDRIVLIRSFSLPRRRFVQKAKNHITDNQHSGKSILFISRQVNRYFIVVYILNRAERIEKFWPVQSVTRKLFCTFTREFGH